MKYDFSSQFLVIAPPSTNFGEAWEHLCETLLRAEHGPEGLSRIAPPDGGIDIYNQRTLHAYQCKSSENGAAGTIPGRESAASLKAAAVAKEQIPWDTYSFATNAPYSEKGRAAIRAAADEVAIDFDTVAFLGPEYWDELCSRHFDVVKDRFYYRITASEKDVLDAFRSARYYPQYVEEYGKKIKKGHFSLVITNNRTPVEIEIPFSEELTVKNYLDVAKQLLGVTLEWANFPDIGTSAGASLSITVDQYAQTFSKKISELPVESGDKLQLWIKIVWRDELQKQAPPDTSVQFLARAMHARYWSEAHLITRSLQSGWDRGKVTSTRLEALIQSVIWDRAHALRSASRRNLGDVSKRDGELKQKATYVRDTTDLTPESRRMLEEELGTALDDSDRLHITLFKSQPRPPEDDE